MVKLEIEVGTDLRSAAAEVASAWKAAEIGEFASPSNKVIFVDWRTLCDVLSGDRYDLMRVVYKTPGLDAARLASKLGREAHKVERDVDALVGFGFISRSALGALSTDIEEIASVIKIAA